MKYRFKPLDELYWGVIIAAGLVLLQGLVTLDPEAVTDWQTWAVALGGGAIRAASGAAIDYIRRSMMAEAGVPEPAQQTPSAEDIAREYFKLRQQEAEQRRAERRASGS